MRLILVLALMLTTGAASAEAVCNDMPTTEQWIACTEDADSTNNINIDLQSGVDITTTGESDHGVHGKHEGSGNIDIDVQRSTITTTGASARAVFGQFAQFGSSDGNIDIDVQHSTITTNGTFAQAVFGQQSEFGSDGNIDIDVQHSTITTNGTFAQAVFGQQSLVRQQRWQY